MGAELRDRADLKWAAQEMRRLAETLDHTARHSAPALVNGQRVAGQPADTVGRAERIIRFRRKRGSIFPDNLFGEPAWDILLDLFVAEARDRKISVSSSCLAAAVPPTTALRWLNTLVEEGLVVREHDARDGRKTYVRLSNEARQKLELLLSTELAVAGGSLIDLAASSPSIIANP